MLWGDWRVCTFKTLCLFFGEEIIFSKTYPQWSLHPLRFPRFRGTETFLTVKEGSTFHLGLLPLKEEEGNRPTRCYICPICPSPAGGSLTHSQALVLSKRARDVTAPSRCSEPLRSKVGGPSKVFAMFLRAGTAWG